MNHFSKATLRKLAKRGIALVGITAIPDMSSDMPCANARTGYCLNDNGTHRVRYFEQVLAIAAGAPV